MTCQVIVELGNGSQASAESLRRASLQVRDSKRNKVGSSLKGSQALSTGALGLAMAVGRVLTAEAWHATAKIQTAHAITANSEARCQHRRQQQRQQRTVASSPDLRPPAVLAGKPPARAAAAAAG